MRAVRTTLLYAILLSNLCRVSILVMPQIVRMVCKELLMVPALPMINACTLTACQPYASRLCLRSSCWARASGTMLLISRSYLYLISIMSMLCLPLCCLVKHRPFRSEIHFSRMSMMKMSGRECCSLRDSTHAGSFRVVGTTLSFPLPCNRLDVHRSLCI